MWQWRGQVVATPRGVTSEQVDPLIQKLVSRLKHEDAVTRCNAAGALRLHGVRAVAAIPELAKLLTDEDPKVRGEARRALERLRAAAA